MRNLVKILVILACVLAIAVSCWKIYGIQSAYHRGQAAYEALGNVVSTEKLTGRKERESVWNASGETEYREETAPVGTEFPSVDFDALRAINPEIVGWLCCEDSPISYPVVQGRDNDYYLHHLFNGEVNGAGCLFLDAGNGGDFSDRNNVIYGHNMRDGSMFNSLAQYSDKAYYDAHPVMLLMTPTKNYRLEIFSCYVLSGWGDAWQLNFQSDADYNAWLMASWEASGTETNYQPREGDRIVTLSTCAYQFEDARYVVLGVLKEE